MHVRKPPKIQNQTKNTKREPELEAPRTDLQIGHHVIEAETISQQGSALPTNDGEDFNRKRMQRSAYPLRLS